MKPDTTWYQHRYHATGSLRLVFTIIPRVPRFVQPAMAVVTAAVFFCLLTRERQAVIRNVRVLTGGSRWCVWSTAYRVFYSFCDFMVSYCYVPHADDDELLAMLSQADRGADVIDECLSDERGLVVWTAHAANWEFASRLLELHGRRVAVARVIERNNAAERQLRDLMTNQRLRPVDLTEPSAVLELLSALRAGDIVAMQGDRLVKGPGIAVPFFGRLTRFPDGPFHLARAAGVALVPGVVVRTGWLKYRLLVGTPIRLGPEEPASASIPRAVASAVAFLEAALREHPEQWLNFFDVWPENHSSPVPGACNKT